MPEGLKTLDELTAAEQYTAVKRGGEEALKSEKWQLARKICLRKNSNLTEQDMDDIFQSLFVPKLSIMTILGTIEDAHKQGNINTRDYAELRIKLHKLAFGEKVKIEGNITTSNVNLNFGGVDTNGFMQKIITMVNDKQGKVVDANFKSKDNEEDENE